MSNLKLWDQVSESDPDTTKRVSQRGGFTAIDAYSQIKKATEVFGQLGEGWGYDYKSTIHDNLIILDFELWYKIKDKKSEPIKITTIKELYGSNGTRLDNDAGKKALTDALTKALSYLGFNADVFLGMFDDNKYVESLRVKKKKTKDGFYKEGIIMYLSDIDKKLDDIREKEELEELLSEEVRSWMKKGLKEATKETKKLATRITELKKAVGWDKE